MDSSESPGNDTFVKDDKDKSNEVASNSNDADLTIKPTFKNSLQAKKRLLAFGVQKENSNDGSSVKTKLNDMLTKDTSINDDNQAQDKNLKKLSKKSDYPDDRAKAIIAEIEEIKKEEHLKLTKIFESVRSQSKSPERESVFKRREKKARNIRQSDVHRKSHSPVREKNVKKASPKNWKEFTEMNCSFGKSNKSDEKYNKDKHNDIFYQLQFESPSMEISPFSVKLASGESKTLPFHNIRYTSAKPIISYSVNFIKFKNAYLSRADLLKNTNRKFKGILEKLFTPSTPLLEPSPLETRNWYLRNWIKYDSNDAKLLENSFGLSFHENYSDCEDENDVQNSSIASTSKNIDKKQKAKNIRPKSTDVKKESTPEFNLARSTTPKRKISENSEQDLSQKVNVDQISFKFSKDSLTPERLPKQKIEKLKKKKITDNSAENVGKLKSTKKKIKHKSQDVESSCSEEDIKKKKKKNNKNKRNKKVSKKKDIKLKIKKREKKTKKKKKEKNYSDSGEEKELQRRSKSSFSSADTSESEDKPKKPTKKKKDDQEEEIPNTIPTVRSEITVMNKESCDLRNVLDKKSKTHEHLSENELDSNKISRARSSSSEKFKKKKKNRLKEKEAKRLESIEQNRTEEKLRLLKNKLEEEKLLLEKDEFDILPYYPKKKAKSSKKKSSNKKCDEELAEQSTPDSDEYHSNWESDNEISPSFLNSKNSSFDVPSLHKLESKGWESEEELIQSRVLNEEEVRPLRRATPPLLEMPLTIKTFSRRQPPLKLSPKIMPIELPEKGLLLDINLPTEILSKDSCSLREEIDILTSSHLTSSDVQMEHKIDECAKTPESSSKDANSLDFGLFTLSNTPELPPPQIKKELENEYEEFMKSLSTTVGDDETQMFSTEPSNDSKLEEIVTPGPAPVPSPKPVELNIVPSNYSPIKTDKRESNDKEIDPNQIDLTANLLNENLSSPNKKPFSFSALALSKKKSVLKISRWQVEQDSDEDLVKEDIVDMQEESNKAKLKPEEKFETVVEDKVTETDAIDKKTEEKSKPTEEKPKVDKKSSDQEHKPEQFGNKRKTSRSRSPPHRQDKRTKCSEESRRDRRDSPERHRDHSGDRRGSQRRSSERRRGARLATPTRRRRDTPPSRRRDAHPSSQKRGEIQRRRLSDRRRSLTPIRRRSLTPKHGGSLKRVRSPARNKSPTRHGSTKKSCSPQPHSPQLVLKRSLADSTISDDMLPQPTQFSPAIDSLISSSVNTILTSAAETPTDQKPPIPRHISPKRISLDDRINQVLGLEVSTTAHPSYQKPMVPQTYHPYNYREDHKVPQNQNKVRQIGNMLEIVPLQTPPVVKKPTSQILQVGNMLQIVPTEIIPTIPMPRELPPLPKDLPSLNDEPVAEIPEINAADERLKERDKRKLEREQRRAEKEQKRKEKQKQKHLKMKMRTENLIKRALQLEQDELDEETVASMLNESQESVTNWPTVPIIISTVVRDPGKGILIMDRSQNEFRLEGRKSVQFADGVRPGEGTSPSGGEELSSPPPPAIPLKRKAKKLKIARKAKKRKVKVKVIKRRSEEESDDEDYENLPPPSPPPGSPPPHIFPARVKVHTINNIRPVQQFTTMPPQISQMLRVPPPPAPQNQFRPQYAIPPLLNIDHMQRPPPPPPSTIQTVPIAYEVENMQQHMPAMPIHRHYDHHSSL